MKKYILGLLLLVFTGYTTFAQQDVSKMTKDDIMQLSYDDLLAMPFEDLLTLANKLGVSTDDLFAMIMNKTVASASKKDEDSFKSPLASTVITKAEIRSYGITSIEEALRLVPGMIVQEKTNGLYDVHIRGLNNIPDNQMMIYTENANTLLMIDGRIAHNYATGDVNFEILPIGVEDIERIEVVRGANAALYGPNALNGVINIITEKTTENSKELQGSLTMGTHENYVGDVAYRKNINKKLSVGITANLQYRRRNTNQLYVYPAQGLYHVSSIAYDENGNPVPKLVDASAGGYYKNTDIENLKQAFTFGAIAGYLPDEFKADILAIQMQKAQNDPEGFKETYHTDAPSAATVGAFLTGLAQSMPVGFYGAMEDELDIADMFDDPGMSRKTYGFNSYLSYRPADDITFDLSLGYQQSRANVNPVGELPFAMCERIFKTGYVNLNGNIKDLKLNVNYMGGPEDYMMGSPGFKIYAHNFQASAEYDLKLGDMLNVVPGVAYNYVNFKDYIPDFKNPGDLTDYSWEYHDHDYVSPNGRHLTGYFNGQKAELKDLAPSLRADFHVGGFRAIAAARFDKTNIPDKWNPSYQVGANYLINDDNIIRASFSTAMRSACFVNSNTRYTWHRDGMMPPDTIYFNADENAPLAKISNVELGYRWRPTDKILVDAEAFYSVSEDFGALKADQSSVIMPENKLYAFMTNTDNLKGLSSLSNGDLNLDVLTEFMNNTSVVTTIKYGELPYKVKQMGFGVNIDWIISPKLIAKVNANVQQTKIDNYYAYNQNAEVLGQLGQIFNMITKVPSMAGDIQAGAINDCYNVTPEQLNALKAAMLKDKNKESAEAQEYMKIMGQFNAAMQDKESAEFKAYEKYLAKSMSRLSDEDQEKVKQLAAEYEAGGKDEAFLNNLLYNSTNNTEYAAYYALKYGVYNDDGTFIFGNSQKYEPETKNGVTHKATPSVYGMVGLIYKPTPKIDIAVYGNYIGKRTYATKYSTEDLDDRFTVSMKLGYKPADGIEVYLNGHNMFNNEQREFPYGDKIGGIYSVGVSFGF